MTHGSLFSGIGGFDLAAEWMGWENKFHCEVNEFCNKVLKYYWPNAESYTDIKISDFSVWRHRIDVLTGGFPCQPYSHAGKRKGKEDDRHLWPFMLTAIKSIQPRWVVGENVLGLVNWSKGLVFHEVQTDLEAAGYEVWPYVLPACAIDAPHRRERIWFIAHRFCFQRSPTRKEGQQCKQSGTARCNIDRNAAQRAIANPDNQGLQGSSNTRDIKSERENRNKLIAGLDNGQQIISNPVSEGREGRGRQRKGFEQGSWDNWPTVEPTIRSRNDGILGKLAGITFPKHRNESIKAYGNSVVPQVVYQIFKAIEQYETLPPPPAMKNGKQKQ